MNVVARPRSVFTFAFDCHNENEQIIASFRHRAFRSTGSIEVDGAQYVIEREGTGLVVHAAGARRALVAMTSEGRGQMSVRSDGRSLTIARSGIGFRMVLVSKQGVVGRLGLRNLFGRTMILDSEEQLSPLVISSLFWLAIARRRQLLMVGGR